MEAEPASETWYSVKIKKMDKRQRRVITAIVFIV
jgi:hypothetical protein